MKKIFLIILILLIIGALIYFGISFFKKSKMIQQEDQNNFLIIKVFFNNSKMDPEFSCNKVFPVERKIDKTLAVGRTALEELLKGPIDSEKKSRILY